MKRKAIVGLILGAEVSVAAYLTLVVWLLSVWFVQDFEAVQMAPADWYREGASRFGRAVIVAVVFYGLAYFANRRWVTPALPNAPRVGTRIAVALTSLIILSGAAGAIQFVVTKPYM